MIRNVIFDMGHVLLYYLPMRACRAVIKNEADAQAVFQAFYGHPSWVDVDLGNLDGDTLTDAVKARLPERLHPAVDELYRGMPENVMFPIDGMPEFVDDVLARGYRVYLLSNAGAFMSRGRYMIPHVERFSGVMYSADEGLIKPDPRLYERLTETYHLKPEECFFVDDSEENVRTAVALGWRAHRFTGDINALKKDLFA